MHFFRLVDGQRDTPITILGNSSVGGSDAKNSDIKLNSQEYVSFCVEKLSFLI